MALREDITERANARLGTVLKGKWRLDAVIGIGGMASVYSATHRNQSRVAIKMLHPEVALDSEVTSRFLREGYVANAVGHPGTVTVLDDDVTEDNAPFLVMELLVGQTLDAMLALQPDGLDARRVLPLVDQLLDVLAAAHDKGIVHRDLKPENLFLTSEGRLKVLDFGIARLRELSAQTGSGTRAGSVLGTPAFMAPEQALGRWHEVDGRTDIWAVGATAFTMLSGRFVHVAESIQEQLVLSATRPAAPLRELAPAVPEELASVVDRALAFQRADRFPDARGMRGALRQASIQGFGQWALTPSTGSLSARVSTPEDLQSATLVAPLEVTSAITGRGETVTTAQPVTTSNPLTSRPARRNGLLAAALVGLLGLGVAGTFAATHRSPSVDLPLTTAGPVIAAPAPPGHPAPGTGLAAGTPAVAPVLASATPAERSAAPAMVPPLHLPPHVASAEKPRGLPTKAPTSDENPFDRRH